jgi:hypothetical protein
MGDAELSLAYNVVGKPGRNLSQSLNMLSNMIDAPKALRRKLRGELNCLARIAVKPEGRTTKELKALVPSELPSTEEGLSQLSESADAVDIISEMVGLIGIARDRVSVLKERVDSRQLLIAGGKINIMNELRAASELLKQYHQFRVELGLVDVKPTEFTLKMQPNFNAAIEWGKSIFDGSDQAGEAARTIIGAVKAAVGDSGGNGKETIIDAEWESLGQVDPAEVRACAKKAISE